MTSKHTPGPWRIGEIRHAGAYQLVQVDAQNGYICDVQAPILLGEFDEETREANARLIAAAPEMLAALEAVQAYFVDGCWCTNGGGHSRAPCLLCIANASITKAKGR